MVVDGGEDHEEEADGDEEADIQLEGVAPDLIGDGPGEGDVTGAEIAPEVGESADGEPEPNGRAARIQEGNHGDEGDHEKGVAAVARRAGDGLSEAEDVGDMTEIEDDAAEEDCPNAGEGTPSADPDRDDESGEEVADLVESAVEDELRLITDHDPDGDETSTDDEHKATIVYAMATSHWWRLPEIISIERAITFYGDTRGRRRRWHEERHPG